MMMFMPGHIRKWSSKVILHVFWLLVPSKVRSVETPRLSKFKYIQVDIWNELIIYIFYFTMSLSSTLNSTPPSFCLLHQLSLQDCWLHKANGGMVLLTFFMCRIALFPYMYWVYGQHYGIPLYSVPFHLPLTANLGNSCILAPQLYWFILLCRKGFRLYKRSRMQDSSPAATITDNSKDD